ncbi:putative E3 ubiquitin-protein ligase UBR7 [Bienertia sinuspersici]
MIQCCVCEDWFHREHLGLESDEKVGNELNFAFVQIPVDEEGEAIYEDLICPGCSKPVHS